MLIGSITNQGSLQGEMNNANGYLTGVIKSAGQLGGQVVGLRGLKGDKGDTGDTGQDGHSPVVTASKVDDTTTVYVDGSAIAAINDGNDGQNGSDGQDGADGYSPSASVSKVGTTATITITDKDGTTTAEIHDGSSGGASAFIAEYGVTTYADVKDAYDEDAIIICTVDDSGNTVICQLAYYDDENGIFYFAQPQSDGFYLAIIASDDTWDDSYFQFASTDTATQLRDGLMSALDWQKLDGIESGAEVNVNADWDAVSGDAQILNKPTIPSKTSDLNNDSGFITGMEILSYGNSTWQNFIDAYDAKKVVYCRASSNSNPASGSQTRLAFMAYVNDATAPTEVEFQYYRSIATHTASQQGDQVFVYKLNKTNGWSVTTREAATKILPSTGLQSSYSNGTLTITAPHDTTKQDTLVSGTNIKTINNTSLLGSGDISVAADGTPIPTASEVAEFDSSAHINSTDMTSQEVEDFVDDLDVSGGGILDMFYPVGSYYETSDTTFDPNIRWGGTWELESEGQVHISSGVNYGVGDTGGEAEVTLTTSEIPAHTHGSKSLTGTFDNRKCGSSAGDGIVGRSGIVTYASASVNANAYGSNGSSSSTVQRITINATHEHTSVGDGGAHNNMPPYVVVNRWHRIA